MTRDQNIATLEAEYSAYLRGLDSMDIACIVDNNDLVFHPEPLAAEAMTYVAECIQEALNVALDPDQDAEPLTPAAVLKELSECISAWYAKDSEKAAFIASCQI